MTALKVTMNRVNGIWEKDAAVRYVLLADATELTIIYPDPNTPNPTGSTNWARTHFNWAAVSCSVPATWTCSRI